MLSVNVGPARAAETEVHLRNAALHRSPPALAALSVLQHCGLLCCQLAWTLQQLGVLLLLVCLLEAVAVVGVGVNLLCL